MQSKRKMEGGIIQDIKAGLSCEEIEIRRRNIRKDKKVLGFSFARELSLIGVLSFISF